MAALITADGSGPAGYKGLLSIFEYTNHDGTLTRTNCGQAAAATFLTHYGKYPADPERAAELMARLEQDFPPDQFFGYFGTGRQQVERICREHELPLTVVEGEEALRECLDAGRPVVVMLGVSAGRMLNLVDLPGGHWMVIYGYDPDYVYLTNWGRMSWEEFIDGWEGMVPWLISMKLKGLATDPLA